MSATGGVMTGRSGPRLGLIGWMLLFAALAVTGIVLTDHATRARVDGTGARSEMYQRIEARMRDGRSDKKLYTASCLYATNSDVRSPFYGEPNPHFKVASCKDSYCEVAIIGVATGEAKLVTALPMDERRFMKNVQRDLCVWVDVQRVLTVIDSARPLP